MKELTKLVALEVLESNESAKLRNGGVSENLRDILMYLEANKPELPIKSEVTVDELFQLVESSIVESEAIERKLATNHKWLSALTKAS